VPQKGKPPIIFYGWWIVASCFTIGAIAAGVVSFGFTVFFNPIVQEFGWSYTAVSFAASLRGFETGLMAPALGFLVDRWGSKWILFAGVLFIGLGLIFLSQVSSLAQFYGIFVVIALGTSCCGPNVANPVINHWFRRNLGKAMGMLTAGVAIGGLLVPVIYKLIESYGWRESLVILGIGLVVTCIPLTFIIKNTPEQYGYQQDGDTGQLGSKASDIKNPKLKIIPVEVNIGVSQALKSRTFWHLTSALTLQMIVILAVTTHIMPYLKTVNIDGSTASFFAGAIPIISIFGRLGAGWLSDKFNRKQVAISFFVMVCIGTLLFDYVRDVNLWLLVLAVILFSVSFGSFMTLRAVLTIEYFGKSRFATIYGFIIGIISLGSMLGPVLAGWTFDVWKSYHYSWIIFTGVNVASLVLMATTPKVRVKETATT
jgi:sugar phosphate permease